MILKTKFKDLFLIKNNTYKDKRGYFKELIRENQLKKKYQPIGFLVGTNNIYLSTNNGRILVANFKKGKIEKIIKLDDNKLQRPVYFNKSLYIAKDNSIIRLN